MSASPVAMKAIPGTEVITCCANARPDVKGSVDDYFGYIAEFLSAEKAVVIKPLSTTNKESIVKRQALKENPYLISLQMRVEGIFLRVHPELKTEAYKDYTLQIESKGEKISLGKITGFIPVRDYSLTVNVYEAYYQMVLEAARRVAAQKKQQSTSTGY